MFVLTLKKDHYMTQFTLVSVVYNTIYIHVYLYMYIVCMMLVWNGCVNVSGLAATCIFLQLNRFILESELSWKYSNWAYMLCIIGYKKMKLVNKVSVTLHFI